MALVLAFSGGCSSASKTVPPEPTSQPTPTQLPPINTPVLLSQDSTEKISLQTKDNQVSLTIVQHGNAVPIAVVNNRRGTVLLAPDSFAIQVEGNKEATSILALTLTDEALLLSLEQSRRPLVAIWGTGYVLYDNELCIFDPPLELEDDPESFLAGDCEDFEQGAALSESLENELGAAPIILFSGRAYLDDRSGESDFTIETITVETINGVRPAETETVLIMVFLENKLEDGHLDILFDRLEWFTFQISFAKE